MLDQLAWHQMTVVPEICSRYSLVAPICRRRHASVKRQCCNVQAHTRCASSHARRKRPFRCTQATAAPAAETQQSTGCISTGMLIVHGNTNLKHVPCCSNSWGFAAPCICSQICDLLQSVLENPPGSRLASLAQRRHLFGPNTGIHSCQKQT